MFVNKFKGILSNPTKFFSNLKKEQGVKSAFGYFTLLSFISGVLALILMVLLEGKYYELLSRFMGFTIPVPNYSLVSTVFLFLFGYIVSLGISFFWAAILHIWVLIFGGSGSFSKSYQLYVYSSTPNLLFSWIPGAGLITWIYCVFLVIIGTQKVHGISKKKAILMYVIPSILMVLLYIGLAILFFKYARPALAMAQSDLASVSAQ